MEDLEDQGPIDDVAGDIRAAMGAALDKALPEQADESDAQKSERLRDEHGKFVAKNTEQPAPEPITDADPVQANAPAPSTAPSMPKAWSAEATAEWSKLPPAVQQAVLKREMEMDAGGRQWSDQRRSYEQALGPVHELADQYQMDPSDVTARLVNVERSLGNPETAAQTIVQLAQSYGVDLVALVSGNPQPQRPAPSFDPNIIPDLIDRRFQAFQQEQAVSSEIQQFAGAKDAAGQLVHPHFANEAVKKHMKALLESDLAPDLQTAYDQAVWSLPDIRTTLMAPKPDVSRQQIVKSKKAGLSLSGAPGNTPAKPKGFAADTSIQDDIRASMDMLRH